MRKNVSRLKKSGNFAIIVSSLAIICHSCSIEEPVDLTLDRKMAFEVAYDYLSYSEGCFELLLSKDEAQELGICDVFYGEMLAYLEDANDAVATLDNLEDIVFFSDGKTRLSSKQIAEEWEYKLSGSLNGQAGMTHNMSVGRDYTNVSVRVYSNALIGLGQVTMRSAYGTETKRTYNILFWNGSAEFSLPVSSGMNISITVSVASDQGGTYAVYYGKSKKGAPSPDL